MKKILIWIGCVGSLTAAACSSKSNIPTENGPPVEDTGISLLSDPNFQNGLFLKGAESGTPSAGQSIYPFGNEGQQPVWQLAEWGSKYLLKQADLREEDGTMTFENEGKLISFKHTGSSTHVRMDVKTSNEYDRPRQQNEAWPHLLVEQAFVTKPLLKDLKNLTLHFDGRLIHSTSKMPPGAFDPGLHTAQFQIFVTVQDLNPQSPKYGDYLWFGVPFYDYRHREIALFAAQDVGKGDATGKFIYSLGTADYMKGSFHDGNWVEVKKDIYLFILKALQTAKERGYLKESKFEDLRLSGMNLGWEVPGTYDAGFEFKNFDLRYTPAK